MSELPGALVTHRGNPALVVRQYRRHILGAKKSWRTARGLIHYRLFIYTYLWAKRRLHQASP